MKKIINRHLYDTDTAKRIKESSTSYPGQFDYCEETLYRKRTNEYFLAGHGGARSRYARRVDQNSWSGGEGIIPLTYDEAQDWCERNMTADEYQAEFGAVSEGERVTLSVSLDSAVADRIRKAAAAAGISVSECIASKF